MTKPGPGKFEGNESEEVAEALYHTLQDGFCVDQFGSSTDGPIWEGLIFVDKEQSPFQYPAYIVEEDMNGFFTYYEFDTEEAARVSFDLDQNTYNREMLRTPEWTGRTTADHSLPD